MPAPLRSPLVLALLVTLANAAKPVVIDDAAYLAYARHIANHPLDPYGFTVFWYTVPGPAFEVLAPPVVPYWLAAGVRLFGEHVGLLKVWMFPFVWVFSWAVRDLLRRFARGTEGRLLPLVVLSPAVLPTANLMLDVPAVGLGLAAVALFARACDRGSWGLAVAAGLVAGLAIQTKYTALLVPPAIAWYGLTHRRFGLAMGCVVAAVAVFAGWELLLVQKYGRSHFAYHATTQEPAANAGESKLAAFVREKGYLVAPLVGHLGCLGIGVGLAAAAALGVRRQSLATAAAVWAIGFALILFIPHRWAVLVPAAAPGGVTTSAANVFWQSFGVLVLVSLAGCAGLLTLRRKGVGTLRVPLQHDGNTDGTRRMPTTLKGRLGVRANAGSWFLVGWLLIELAGYFALTPFGAARRVIGLVAVGGLLAGRALSRTERIRPNRRLPNWIVWFGIAVGVAIAAIDTLDAFPEKVCAERAAAVAAVVADQPPGSTAWFAGHWGFQFYCERAGMRPVVPGESVLAPGDVLVLPVYPDEHGFYRPHIGLIPIRPPADAVEVLAEVVWTDPLSATTVPNFYCGVDPVACRDHPRLRVAVYRVTRAWAVPGS